MTAWTEQRDTWVTEASPDQLLAVIVELTKVRKYILENLGDLTEHMETMLWVATRGVEGREWGIAAEPAERVGGWSGGGGRSG